MRGLLLFGLVLAGLTLQSTLFSHLAVAEVKPDLILILVAFYSIMKGARRGLFFGFLAGLLEDVFLGRFIGMNALAKGLTGFLAGWVTRGAFSENLLVPISTLFLGTFFNQFLYFIIGKTAGLHWTLELWFWKSFPQAIYNTCLVPFFYSHFYYWVIKENEIPSSFWDRFS